MGMIRGALLLAVAGLAAATATADPLADGVAARTAQHYDDAMRILLPLANGGNDEAQRIVGEMIFNGQGAPRSVAASLAWTRLAAENGNRIGQYNLGYMYETGAGVPRSIDDAVTWYAKSGRQGYVLAQRKLGDLYAGSSVEESTYWYNLARLNGDDVSLQRYSAGATQLAAEAKARSDAEAAEKYERERADREATQRMMDEARPSGNVYAQGIAEALGKVQQDSARLSAIHEQSMANIRAQQVERLRQEREQAARQHAQDERNRQVLAERERAVSAANAADQARREQARAELASGIPAQATGARAAAQPAAGSATARTAPARPQQTAQAQQPAQTGAQPGNAVRTASAAPNFPVYTWRPYRFLYTEHLLAQNEDAARASTLRARQDREQKFDNAVAKYRAGQLGYQSWRMIREEPMRCVDRLPDQPRHDWHCELRVDYQIVSTEKEDMGDTIYTHSVIG
jgi:hypothetical protein